MKQTEALKVALDLATMHHTDDGYAELRSKVRQLAKEALAQPEQEPHSWYSKQEDEWMTHKIRMEHERLNSYTHKVGKFDLALYTTPPPVAEPHKRKPWVSLTDEEMQKASEGLAEYEWFIHGAFWAEAKLKEKNT